MVAYLRQCWRFRRRAPPLSLGSLIALAMFVALVTVKIVLHFRVDIHSESFLELTKCPACYGSDLCVAFQEKEDAVEADVSGRPVVDDLVLDDGWLFDYFFNVKRVYRATFLGNVSVVIKKLSHHRELDKLDALLCDWYDEVHMPPAMTNASVTMDVDDDAFVAASGAGEKCEDVGERLRAIVERQLKESGSDRGATLAALVRQGRARLAARHGGATSPDALHCPSNRFLSEIITKFETTTTPGLSAATLIAQLLTMLLVNPEPIVSNIFNTVSVRFPRILGSCGRVVAEEYAGPTLNYYATSSLNLRLKIARQLLLLADELTFNSSSSGLNVYLTDVSFDNFAVVTRGDDNDLRVTLVDAEGVIVTDPEALAVMGANQTLPSQPHQQQLLHANPYGGQGRLRFSPDDLCSYPKADHNHYAICECLLSETPCTPGIRGGLLWGIPNDMEEKWKIRKLIRSCQTGVENRLEVTHDLIEAIEGILE